MKQLIFLIFGICMLSGQAYGQQLIVVEDRSELLDTQGTSLLNDELNRLGYSLVFEVDFRSKCDYLFGKILPVNDGFLLQVESCDERVLGSKFLTSEFQENTTHEQAHLLASYFMMLSSASTRPIFANWDSVYTTGAPVSLGAQLAKIGRVEALLNIMK